MLNALEEHLAPPQTIVLRGDGETLARWHARAWEGFLPGRIALAVPTDPGPLSGLLAQRARGRVRARNR